MNEDAVLGALEQIYGSIGTDKRWEKTLDAIAKCLGFDGGVVASPSPQDPRDWYLATKGYSRTDECVDQYLEYFHSIDPLFSAGLTKGRFHQPCVTNFDTLVDQKALLKSEFYNDYLKNLDVISTLGFTVLPFNDGDSPQLNIQLFKQSRNNPFSGNEKNIANVLLPHLFRSAQFELELWSARSQVADYENIFESNRIGFLLVDRRGAILVANSAARKIFSQNDGLTSMSGQAVTANAKEQRDLDQLISQAVSSQKNFTHNPFWATRVSRPSGKPPYIVSAMTIPRKDVLRQSFGQIVDSTTGILRIWSDDLLEPKELGRSLRSLFSLTDAEVRFALAFHDTASIQEAADILNISSGTARNVIKSLFRKTQTSNQAGLMKILAGLV